MIGKYENDDWLGVSGARKRNESVQGEWPVSYHGTQKDFAHEIGKKGYDLSKGKRFKYGRGIYSTPDPKIAEQYGQTFTHKGETYKIIIMNRSVPHF